MDSGPESFQGGSFSQPVGLCVWRQRGLRDGRHHGHALLPVPEQVPQGPSLRHHRRLHGQPFGLCLWQREEEEFEEENLEQAAQWRAQAFERKDQKRALQWSAEGTDAANGEVVFVGKDEDRTILKFCIIAS